jgi:hypothetical protein
MVLDEGHTAISGDLLVVLRDAGPAIAGGISEDASLRIARRADPIMTAKVATVTIAVR